MSDQSRYPLNALVDELTERIVSRRYPAGEWMPSVRQIATEFEVNRATAQLGLTRLHTMGFVDVARNRGFIVKDIYHSGGVDVYQQLFRAAHNSPSVAHNMFCDLLDVQRNIVAEVLALCLDGQIDIDLTELSREISELQEFVTDIVEFSRREVAILRRLCAAAGNSLRLALFNSIWKMVTDTPWAFEAYYVVAPERHVQGLQGFVGVMSQGVEPLQSVKDLVQDLVGGYFERVLGAFDVAVGVLASDVEAVADTA